MESPESRGKAIKFNFDIVKLQWSLGGFWGSPAGWAGLAAKFKYINRRGGALEILLYESQLYNEIKWREQ